MWRHKPKCFELGTTPCTNTHTLLQTTVQLFLFAHILFIVLLSYCQNIHAFNIFLGLPKGDLPVFEPVSRKEVRIDKCTVVTGLMKAVDLKTGRVKEKEYLSSRIVLYCFNPVYSRCGETADYMT